MFKPVEDLEVGVIGVAFSSEVCGASSWIAFWGVAVGAVRPARAEGALGLDGAGEWLGHDGDGGKSGKCSDWFAGEE